MNGYLRDRRSTWIAVGSALALAIVLSSCPGQKEGEKAVIARLSVSPQQEANMNLFLSWVDTTESLRGNSGLKDAYQAGFVALKQNDYTDYVVQSGRLDDERGRLNQDQKTAMYQFFQTLSVESEPSPVTEGPKGGGGRCSVSCLFGSCDIECPAGTKPKCFCQWGDPHCGCEPYSAEN